jgi:mannose-6-phosphate isomerase-like protein (cupin superfamily)
MPASTSPAEITMQPLETAPTTPVIVPAASLVIGTKGTRRFVGREHGAGISYFFVDAEPGDGPDLHWHPYTETWFVIEGVARITIGTETLEARAEDTATVPVGVWHGFKNAGEGRLRILCIHASDTIIQTWAD